MIRLIPILILSTCVASTGTSRNEGSPTVPASPVLAVAAPSALPPGPGGGDAPENGRDAL